ncbi:MAG: type IV secretion system DNA-binding domain-containing protein, partial [Neisseria animaloris]|nr:type IV secretion system DNA-binding domain-containing protein [Neisseria animaloris]
MFESLYEQISAKNAIRYMVYPLWNAPLAGYIAGWLIVILISILSAWITWHVSDRAVSKAGNKAVWYRWIGTVIAGGFSLWLSLPIIQMAYQVRTPQQLLLAGMFFWLAVTALVVFILMKCFRPLPLIRKTRDYRDYYLRGSRLVDSEQFNRINRKAFAFEQEKIEPLKVGKLLIPTAAESYHFAVLGATGSGKSQVMLPFIRTINRRNQSMIVFDIGGDFWRRCRREQDVFFNPLVTGKGGFAWNPLKEIQKPEDCDMLAAAICSTNESDASGKRWTEYARTFVSGCLRAMNYSADIEQFLYLLTEATPEELAGYLSGTPAAGFVQENNEETFQSIRTTVIRFIQAWQFMIPDIHA